MVTLSFILDTRNTVGDEPAPIKLRIGHKRANSLLHMEVKLRPSEWNPIDKKPKNERIAAHLSRIMLDAQDVLFKLKREADINAMSAGDIRDAIKAVVSTEESEAEDPKDTFEAVFLNFTESRKATRTKELYECTHRILAKFEPRLSELRFEDIDKNWLACFDAFMAKTAPSVNARAIHMRNIRAVFNYAIDDERTTNYPFRKFKIKSEATRKRSLSVKELRQLFNEPCDDIRKKYQDMLKLIFFLIGINVVDLTHAKELYKGRLEYKRAKTGRLYSIKVEPEAMEIINRNKGDKYLLSPLDTYKDHRDYLRRLNEGIRLICNETVKETRKEGRRLVERKYSKSLFPELTTYWLRHTWATIASSIDIPKETIAAALGHGGRTVTDIYIDFDQKKVDDANRRVMDYVLYGK